MLNKFTRFFEEKTMKIILNYREVTIDREKLSVKELLELKKVKMPHMVSVQLNGKIIKKQEYETTNILDNDKINLLYYIGGG